MIAERSTAVTEGNLTGKSYQAGIDDENMGWVISLFTDLYSDPQRAIVREYSTNARDAQIEAGVDRPIEVTLPSALAPFFKIKDFGVGLAEEEIGTIYSRYGTSTKRNTNDQNGMLGMGCKSALAYAQQFTVESVKDGMRTVCIISREDGGVPQFTTMPPMPDDGPNGTEVIVPVQRHHHDDFARKAREFYSYWPEGHVLLDGEEPAKKDGLRLADDLLLVRQENGYYNRKPNTVVMGGVPYPVDGEQVNLGAPEGYYLIVNVPTGSCMFPPSREALLYTPQTRETLNGIPARVAEATAKAVQREVESATTAQGAIRAMLEYRKLLGPSAKIASFKFKGRELPERVDGRFTLVPWRSGKLAYSESCYTGLDLQYVVGGMLVVGYDVANFTATHKRKLMQYVTDNGLDQPQYFILAETQPDMTWLTDVKVAQWSDVKATKLPVNSTAGIWRNGRPTGSFDCFIAGAFKHMRAEDIDQSEAIYYCRQRNRWESDKYAFIIAAHDPNATVVCVPENRYAKFKRNFPEALGFEVGCQRAYEGWSASLTKGQRAALTIDAKSDYGTLRSLDPSRIDDPALRAAVHVTKRIDLGAIQKAEQKFRPVLHMVKRHTANPDWECPLARYSLIEGLPYSFLKDDHLYIYLNAVHAAEAR